MDLDFAFAWLFSRREICEIYSLSNGVSWRGHKMNRDDLWIRVMEYTLWISLREMLSCATLRPMSLANTSSCLLSLAQKKAANGVRL